MTPDLAHRADERYRQHLRRGLELSALLSDPTYRPTSGHDERKNR